MRFCTGCLILNIAALEISTSFMLLQKCRVIHMDRRAFLAAVACLLSLPSLAQAGAAAAGAQKFIDNLGEATIGSLTGSSLSEVERETRFRSLLESQFDMPGMSKFVLARYWRVASDNERADFQRLFETLLVQAYAQKFTEYTGERFQVSGSQANDDDSITVNSLINRPNGDVVRLDWRVADAGGLKISDLIVDGVSLRTTYRSDVASVIQNNGGKVADLIDALRQKTSSP
jgi:phospholipid transport system substrate-binding protein